jgi:membrane protein YdbS with pleckstrin-like domain
METTSLVLVLLSAVLHAVWNFLAKTIPGGAAFVWLLAAVMSVLLLPLALGYVVLYGFDCFIHRMGRFFGKNPRYPAFVARILFASGPVL